MRPCRIGLCILLIVSSTLHSMQHVSISGTAFPDALFTEHIITHLYIPLAQGSSNAGLKDLVHFAKTCKRFNTIYKAYIEKYTIKDAYQAFLMDHITKSSTERPVIILDNKQGLQMLARAALVNAVSGVLYKERTLSIDDSLFFAYLILEFMKKNNYDLNESFDRSKNCYIKEKYITPPLDYCKVPLLEACRNIRKDLVILLLHYGANPNAEYRYNKKSGTQQLIIIETPMGTVASMLKGNERRFQEQNALTAIKKLLMPKGRMRWFFL